MKRKTILDDLPVVGLSLLAAALLLLAAATPWWHVIGTAEPLYVRCLRLLSLLPALGACMAIPLPRLRAPLFVLGGGLAILLPGLVVLTIVTRDPASIGAAIYQNDQASQLIKDITRTSLNAEVPWTEQDTLAVDRLARSDYTFVDGVETALHFAKGGWYAGCIGGTVLLLAAWTWDGGMARVVVRRCRWGLAATAAALMLFYGGPNFISLYYWHCARAAQASADYGTALRDYRMAARWDGRLAYDRFFHFNLGRLYQMMGMTQEPDYWAWRGDLEQNLLLPQLALLTYRDHVLDPSAEPDLRFRFADMLVQAGGSDYRQGRYGDAIDTFRSAEILDPNNVQIMYGLALSTSKAGDYTTSVLEWRRLIAANENVGVYRYKYFVSASNYRKVITARAWSGLAWCYHRQHNEAAALACLSNSTNGGNVPDTPKEQ